MQTMKGPSQQASRALAQAATFSAPPYAPTVTRREASGVQGISERRGTVRGCVRDQPLPSPASRAALTD